ARTLSFHLGVEEVTIDLDRHVSEDELRRAEARANEIVWQARPVSVREVTRGEAESLLAGDIGRLHGGPAPDERAQNRSTRALEPRVALLGSRADKAYLVFAQSEGLPHDVPALLRDALTLVGGRGGGRGNLAQGGGDRPEGLDAALANAEQTVRARAVGGA